eukprot:gb/GEZN01018539.1/.p1 GENE.gb/GEZN01018539.1/~~gb/GEZN01018539.1/.p1  ORF type:complete len:198 (+),score=15.09 gb/GEZN01018539.1/:22-615(+)
MNVSWLGPTACPNCNTNIPGNVVNCPKCGQKKPAKEQQDFSHKLGGKPELCLECGRENPFGTQNCPDCGTRPGSKISGPVYDQAYVTKVGDLCKGCDKQILESMLEALGSHWHKECFVCQTCRQALTGSFGLVEGKPVCINCQSKPKPTVAQPKPTSSGTSEATSGGAGDTSKPKFCTSCGTKTDASKFCQQCGTKL